MTDHDEVRFDEHYYRHDCGIPYERNEHWLTFFGEVADGIVREFAPQRVLDVGCAMGFLVEALRARGVEAWGIDVSEFAISKADDSVQPFCAVASADEDLPRHFPSSFDLVTCVEVIEHIPSASARAATENLARWGRQILFSSSSDDFAEPTHVNVLPAEEWSAMLVEHGMVRDFDVDGTFLTPWTVVYTRSAVTPGALVRRYDRRLDRYRRENQGLRSGIVRLQRAAADTEQRVQATVEAETAERRTQDLHDLRAELAVALERAAGQEAQLADLRLHYDAAIRDREALQQTGASQLAIIEDRARQLESVERAAGDLVHQLRSTSERQDQLDRDLEREREASRRAQGEAVDAQRQLDQVLASRSLRAGRLIAAPVRWLTGTVSSSAKKRHD